MNAFLEHHFTSISLRYHCFDRILMNAIVQTLQADGAAAWFLKDRRGFAALTSQVLRTISADYHDFIGDWERRGIPVVEAPKKKHDHSQADRHENFVEPYYQWLGDRPGVALVLKSRENARVAISRKTRGLPHLEFGHRFIWQYYFYINDVDFGRMFIRVATYFPFNCRVCLNGHEWIARGLQKAGIGFRKEGNAFLSCDDPARLQRIADQLTPGSITRCVHRWLAQLVPFYTDAERRRGGCGYRLFFSQLEYCDNLVFHRRASLDRLMDRLLDENRTIGRPDRISFIFGRRKTQKRLAGMKTKITDYGLSNPVIRSHFAHSAVKQYVRDHRLLRTEVVSNDVRDLVKRKSVELLPSLRESMQSITDRYQDVQQDVLDTYVDRGELARLKAPTVTESGQRIPGLKLDDDRLLAVMQSLVRFAPLAKGGQFRTRDLHQPAAQALSRDTATYTLTQLRYDLRKLRAKGLVEKVPRTQRYRLTPDGYRLCVLFLKLHHRVLRPLTSGMLSPPADSGLSATKLSRLDSLYQGVDQTLDRLCRHIGLHLAG